MPEAPAYARVPRRLPERGEARDALRLPSRFALLHGGGVTLTADAAVGAGVGAFVGPAWRTERRQMLPVGVRRAEGGMAAGLQLSARS